MRVLVACEFSGVVRDAFAALGHDAWSCDLIPSESLGQHIQDDVRKFLHLKAWDLIIAHPPCTDLAVSGARYFYRKEKEQEEALEFIREILAAPCEKICLENPVGIISTRIRRPDQIIQPYEFGEDASKRTCLWLKNLPKLLPVKIVPPRIVNGKKRWGNQTDSGQNRLTPSDTRAADRSRTYPGVAAAMASQWSAA